MKRAAHPLFFKSAPFRSQKESFSVKSVKKGFIKFRRKSQPTEKSEVDKAKENYVD